MRAVRLATRISGAFAVLLLLSCGGPKTENKTESASAPVRVQVVSVAEGDWPVFYEAPGSVRARTSSTLASKVMGYVREVRVEPGARVRAGQVLVVLDSHDLDAAYSQAEAARNEARAGIADADNAIAGAQAALDLATVTRRRMKDLLAKRSVSNQEYDEADARFRQAQAALDGARSRRSRVNDTVAQASAGLQAAAIARGYAQIPAPFSGIVVERRAEPGALAIPGAPLLIVEQEGGWRFEATVEEAKLPQVRLGQPVSIQLDSLDRELSAKVTEIVPVIDSASRSAIVRLDLPAIQNLRSGLFGRARFSATPKRSLSVPINAVVERGQLQQVFVVNNGLARLRMVTLGAGSKGRREVLSGLAAGEMVIAPVSTDLSDGVRVEVRP